MPEPQDLAPFRKSLRTARFHVLRIRRPIRTTDPHFPPVDHDLFRPEVLKFARPASPA